MSLGWRWLAWMERRVDRVQPTEDDAREGLHRMGDGELAACARQLMAEMLGEGLDPDAGLERSFPQAPPWAELIEATEARARAVALVRVVPDNGRSGWEAPTDI